MEKEGNFKDCLGEVRAGPGQGGVLGDNEVPHKELWERDHKQMSPPRGREGGAKG